jgi:CRP/FNR family transcriptional regulator, cyclic AMP receptor protein
VAMLSNVPLFSGLSKKQLKELAAASHELVLEGGATVIEEGADGDEFFIVADGAVAVTRGGSTLAELGAGDHFGEMSLIDDGPRTATVTTEGHSTLLAIDRETFRALLYASPDTAIALLTHLAHRLREP